MPASSVAYPLISHHVLVNNIPIYDCASNYRLNSMGKKRQQSIRRPGWMSFSRRMGRDEGG